MLHMLSPVFPPALSGLHAARMGLSTHFPYGALTAKSAPPPIAVHPQAARRQRRALVVEDDPRLRRSMSAHIAAMGFQVLTASHYAAALAHLDAGALDIACIDIGLPTESGYELCEHIRGPLGLKFLSIMMTSEFGSPEYLAYAEHAGADAFLVKPFSMPELGLNISALLSGRMRARGSRASSVGGMLA
jgi:DNA-binding response OmpR family regulator